MKIYDGHMHIEGNAQPHPDVLLEKFEKVGVEGACLFSIDPEDPRFTYEERMKNLFQWTDGYGDRLFPIAWLHPNEKDVLDKVRDAADRGVLGYKFIPDTYHVHDEMPTKVFKLIEELGLPIFFHTGICYDFHNSAQYCNPVDWDCFIEYKNIRVSIAHAGFPWCDTALHLFSKFYYIGRKVQRAALGTEITYLENPWMKAHLAVENGETVPLMPELYLDMTPGPSGTFRENLYRNLLSWCPQNPRVFYGSDYRADDYPVEYVRKALDREKELMERFEVSEEMQRGIFSENLLRFLGKTPRISDI